MGRKTAISRGAINLFQNELSISPYERGPDLMIACLSPQADKERLHTKMGRVDQSNTNALHDFRYAVALSTWVSLLHAQVPTEMTPGGDKSYSGARY